MIEPTGLRARLGRNGFWQPGQMAGRRWRIGCVSLEITQRCSQQLRPVLNEVFGAGTGHGSAPIDPPGRAFLTTAFDIGYKHENI